MILLDQNIVLLNLTYVDGLELEPLLDDDELDDGRDLPEDPLRYLASMAGSCMYFDPCSS